MIHTYGNHPIMHMLLRIHDTQTAPANAYATLGELFNEKPYFSIRELHKHLLFLPDNDFGQYIAGALLMDGIPQEVRLLKKGIWTEIISVNPSRMDQMFRHSINVVGQLFFAGMPRFQLTLQWKHAPMTAEQKLYICWHAESLEIPK